MNQFSRAIAVLTQPGPEMSRAAQDPVPSRTLFTSYGLVLGALPALGALLAIIIFAGSALSYIIVPTVISLFLLYLLRDVGLAYAAGLGANALAPKLGGQRNKEGALKLAVYAATPIWVAGFLAALLIPLGSLTYLVLLAGFGFAGYILYLGCGPLLGVPQNQAAAFAAVIAIAWLVLYFVVAQIVQRVFFSMLFGSAVGGYGL